MHDPYCHEHEGKWAKLFWDTSGTEVGWGWVTHDSEDEEAFEGGSLGDIYDRADVAAVERAHYLPRAQLCALFQKEVPDWCEDFNIFIERNLI